MRTKRQQKHRSMQAARPDFASFADALEDEARWSAEIHSNDKTGQAATDQRRLRRLAQYVRLVGKLGGYL